MNDEEEKINQSADDSQQAAEENNAVEQPETQNATLQTAYMEVHHHPHVEKKNFKEYFLEFLMIFLAVTMGFVAENIREHIAETKSAHQYLESYRNDLLQNEKRLKFYDSTFTINLPVYDSIVDIFY